MNAMSRHEGLKKAAFVCVILILVLGLMISGLRILESTVFFESKAQVPQETAARKTIVRDGIAYYPRQDLTTILVMGIDEKGPVKHSGSYVNSGAADAVLLVTIDEAAQEICAVALNRDTMVEMPVLGVDGRVAGKKTQQLALAHTYGSGLEDSCENMVNTVSGFLGNVEIDYYVSMNMDGIEIANDAVGGVTVTIEDDFSQIDPTLKKGEVTLSGEQAYHYVQTRKGVGNQLNISRMKRQEEYVRGFVASLETAMDSDNTFVIKTYDALAPYMVTDISVNTFSGFMQRYADYAFVGIVSPEGENVLGEEYYEFHADEEKLEKLVLDIFYKKK